ncbi:MAG: adenylate/guanylate cyclase domain-containing protein [Propylenella sp.]
MERRLAALLNADVVGYSRLMSKDEAGTLRTLMAYEARVIEPTVATHRGRIVKRMGDGYLAEFGSIVDAVECALSWQQQPTAADELPLRFRIGVHLGDIIVEGDDIYGDGVNIAARIEALAQPGCIMLSDDAFRQVRDRVEAEFHDLGEHEVKNIPRPLRVWEWRCPMAVPRRLQNVSLPPLETPSIVILPFRNLTGDPANDYLTDGLRMDIQNALVKVSGLFIIASGSAYAFRGAGGEETACTLNVRYALQGSIMAAGQRMRVTAELTEAASGRIVWGERFDRPLDDSFDLQDEITGRVLAAMNVKLVQGEQAKVWHKTLKDLRALEAFYKGVHAFYQMDRDGMQRARQYFERVAEIRPDASVGATWAAMTHWFDLQRGWSESPEKSKELARRWAEIAASMPDADGQAHSALSYLYLMERRFDEALAAGRYAVANRPTCAYANCFHGNVLHYCDDQDGAIHHIRLAIRTQPLHPPFYLHMLAGAHRAKGDLEAAIVACRQALELSRDDIASRIILASAYVRQGQRDLAAETAAEIRSLDPSFLVTRFADAQPYRDGRFAVEFAADLRAAGLPA